MCHYWPLDRLILSKSSHLKYDFGLISDITAVSSVYLLASAEVWLTCLFVGEIVMSVFTFTQVVLL